MNTQETIHKEQQRETSRSIHRQAVELQRKQNISYAAAKSQTEQRDTAQPVSGLRDAGSPNVNNETGGANAQFKTAQILCPEVLAHAKRLAEALRPFVEKGANLITSQEVINAFNALKD